MKKRYLLFANGGGMDDGEGACYASEEREEIIKAARVIRDYYPVVGVLDLQTMTMIPTEES